MPKLIWTHRTKSFLEHIEESLMKLKSTLGILEETADMLSFSKFSIQTLKSITVASVARGLSIFVFLSMCCPLSLSQPVLDEHS